jgi:transcriptional regulator with XRE-family HTH domain
MTELAKQLGVKIKQIRKTAKLTQERLAEKTGLSVEYISRIERGVSQPSFKTLEMLADALNVTAKDFWDFKAPVLFRDKKLEAKEKKGYIEAIYSGVKEMEVRELMVVSNVVKALGGKTI